MTERKGGMLPMLKCSAGFWTRGGHPGLLELGSVCHLLVVRALGTGPEEGELDRNGASGEQSPALWFNRGMGSKIQGFISGLSSAMCIDRLCQRESMMVTLSPGLKHQCTMEKSPQI